MNFKEWWRKEVLPLNSNPIYQAGLKVAWEAAQVEQAKEVEKLKKENKELNDACNSIEW